MGAAWFEVRIGNKKTAKAAFNEAVKEAQYDYGHSGYTGSIAEKNEFIMLNDKPIDPNEAQDLIRKIKTEG